MDWLVFCFFISVILFLWALLFRVFTGWYMSNVLSKKFKIVPGPKPFSFQSLILTTNDFTLTIQNIFISINFFGLFSARFVFLTVLCDSIEIEFFHKPHHTLPRVSHTVSENIFIQVFLHILTMLIKKIIIKINQIIVKKNSFSMKVSKLGFDYLMQNKVFCVDLETQSLLLNIKDFINIQFEPISFHPRFDADPILSLINLEALAIPFGYKVPIFKMNITDNNLTIDSVDCSFILPRGKIESTTPALKAKFSIPFPKFSLIIYELSGFFSRHLFEIQNLNLDVNQIAMRKLKLFNEDRLLLKISHFSGSQTSNEVWEHSFQDLDILYHTKTGLCVVPFITKEIMPYIEKNMKKKDVLILPTFSLNISNLLFHFKLTDHATLDFNLADIIMEDSVIKISSIQTNANDVKLLVMKMFNIYVNTDNFLEIDFSSLHLHARTEIYIADFFMEFIYAWRAIAPFILKHKYDTESLPFPITMKCDVVSCKFHDTVLHQSISRANRILPNILADSYVREFLLSKRVKELSMAANAQTQSLEKLRELKFAEYVNEVKKEKVHKHRFKFIFSDFSIIADARNFTDKLKMIYQFDPTTKQYYSDIQWETMFGMKFEMFWKKVEVYAFDIEKPIIFGTDILFRGPLIIAEPRNKIFVDLNFTLDGEKFTSSKNPMKLRFYTDMLISADEYYYYFADCMQPVYQEMTLCFNSIIPNGVDPSGKLVWWDMMRSQMRGQFLFKAKIFEARFMGTTNYRDLSNYMPIKLYRWHMLWREGDTLLNVERWFSPRVFQNVEGPVSLDLPKINWTFKFHWVTVPGNDPKKYIVFPNVRKFGEPEYDTYKDFRATEIYMDDSTLSFSEIDGVIPNFTFDLAHFEWFAQPLLLFGAAQRMKGQIAKKLGFHNVPRPPMKYFIELKRHGWLRVIANVFVFRIFDHFPISGSQNVQGSSVDLRLNDFQIMTHVEMTYDGNKFTSKFKCESLSINATDLAHYASVDPRRTPSFITMAPLTVDYGDQTIVGIEEITLHFNQFLLKYIQDFMTSTEHIRAKVSKPKPSFAEVSVNDYPNKKITLNVDVVRVLFISLESELQAMGIVEKMTLNILGKENIEETGTAIRMLVEQFKLLINTQDPRITGANPLICVNRPDIFNACKCSQVSMETMSLNASPMDISALNSILDECFGDERPTSPSNSPMNNESKVSLCIPSIKIGLNTSNEFTLIELQKMNANFHNYIDKTIEVSIMISNGHITNSAKDQGFRDVLKKWEQQSVQKAARPLIHIQLKMPPKISGAYIFSQVEINIEPTIICYDAKFWDDLIATFKIQTEEKPSYGEPFIIIGENDTMMPFQTFDKMIFPDAEDNAQLYNQTNKSIRIKNRQQNMKTMMMLRYFRLNPISMNVSYRNPDNKILSEINNFQGQLHEIIYHDLSVSTTEVIEKLMADIARDMIPQFIKHVVGFKRPDKTQEQLIEEWLKSDSDKLSQKEKQKKLLFGPKTVKKK